MSIEVFKKDKSKINKIRYVTLTTDMFEMEATPNSLGNWEINLGHDVFHNLNKDDIDELIKYLEKLRSYL